MFIKAVLKPLSVFAAIFGCLASISSIASAQDDPNAHYVLVQSGELASQTREIEVPVETGVFKLQFNLQHTGDAGWTIITPSGKPLDPDMPNLAISNSKEGAKGRRSILMWDPRPGKWKIRLSGSGKFTASVTAQGELHVCCIQFFGRNGVYPMDRFQPVRGARSHAQIYASGYNIGTIEFQLINEQGEIIAPVKFRQSDYSNPYNFTLLVETPGQPFRVLARGRDMNGKSFQRVIGWLVRPQSSNAQAEGAQAEGGIQTRQWAPPQEWNKDLVEGEYKVVRARIVSWTDEPLLSDKGNPIGIRLKYSISFPVEGSYSPFPSVYPERVSHGFTGALGMRVHKGSVEPAPDGLPPPTQWVFGGRGNFKADIVYNFTVDLIPNYAVFNEQKSAFCLQTKAYSQQAGQPGNRMGLRERFEREVMSEVKIRYRLTISGTDLDGRQPMLTENAYAPIVWHRGYLKEGAGECP
ncbi:MAG: hypothetical protein AB7U82_27125 [Blastocatellales bacterium]